MTKFLHGTPGNDEGINALVGSSNDVNVFFDVGIGSDVAIGGQRNDIFHMRVDEHPDKVDGGAGEDTIDYSGADRGVRVDLANGTVTASFTDPATGLSTTHVVTEVANVEDVVGSRFNDTIIGSSADNRLDGGAGDDKLYGGDGNDTLTGGTGNNLLNGGSGTDTVDYSSSQYSVFADLGTGKGAEVVNPATQTVASQDTYVSIENVTGSSHDDFLVGNSGANVINGGDGNDVIEGGGGNDTLIGGGGDDRISAQSNVGETASLSGGDGNDTLFGSAGKDVMDGGNGTDWADYSLQNAPSLGNWAPGWTSLTGVNVDLEHGVGHGGWAEGDTYTNIENVRGTAYNDVITGDDNNNVLAGNGGSDVIHGGGGDDTLSGNGQLFGDEGNDTFIASGSGTTLYDGGAGTDTVDYSQSQNSVIVDLTNSPSGFFGVHSGEVALVNGHLQNVSSDSYNGIENVIGSQHDDIIAGDDSANVIIGNGGNDIIHGGGGDDTLSGNGHLFGDDGNDTFIASSSGTTSYDGGAGTDTVDYSQATDRVIVDLTGSLAVLGLHSGQLDDSGHNVSFDSYSGIENIEGGQNNDLILTDNNDNVIDGNDGNDVIMGLGGNDTINGGKGDDIIEGGAGADTLDGGDGVNTLAYSQSAAGVVVNLATQTASGGDAAGDVISNFQNVEGSDHDDTLIGSGGNNLFFEEAGKNVLIGGGGLDTFAFASNLTGSNLIADFHVGEDKLAIVGEIGAQNLSDLHFTQLGGGTLITFANESGSILLAGVNAANLEQHASTEIVFSQTLDPLLHG